MGHSVSKFGKSCAVQGAFRSVVYLAARYESNLQQGLVENVMAGGDSAARGLLLGMILGAHNGIAAVPEHWIAGLKSAKHISELLGKIVFQLYKMAGYHEILTCNVCRWIF